MATQTYAEFRTKGRHDRPTRTVTPISVEGVIANGYLRLDREEEWIRAVEKRRAALGR